MVVAAIAARLVAEGSLGVLPVGSVDAFNLLPILATYGGVTRGTAPFHPLLLVKVLLYAYAVGIPASRQIAWKLEEDVAFRVLAENQRPDFRTLSDFRKQHLLAQAERFV